MRAIIWSIRSPARRRRAGRWDRSRTRSDLFASVFPAAAAVQNDELKRLAADKCIAYARRIAIIRSRPTDDLGGVRGERPQTRSLPRPVRRIPRLPASVSKTCLVRFGNNKYSVAPAPSDDRSRSRLRRPDRDPPGWARRCEHPRCWARRDRIRSLALCAGSRKPGALRNGAPLQGLGVLPAAMERVRRKLASTDDGDRQMVSTLSAVLTDGCQRSRRPVPALVQASIPPTSILNILARRRDPHRQHPIATPASLSIAPSSADRRCAIRQPRRT